MAGSLALAANEVERKRRKVQDGTRSPILTSKAAGIQGERSYPQSYKLSMPLAELVVACQDSERSISIIAGGMR